MYSTRILFRCMYVCMMRGISVTYFVFILYICVWVYWGDGNKFMFICMYVCMYVCMYAIINFLNMIDMLFFFSQDRHIHRI